jgi:hypothetical protein
MISFYLFSNATSSSEMFVGFQNQETFICFYGSANNELCIKKQVIIHAFFHKDHGFFVL